MNKKYMVVTLNQNDDKVYINYADTPYQALSTLSDIAMVQAFADEIIIARVEDGVIVGRYTQKGEWQCSD